LKNGKQEKQFCQGIEGFRGGGGDSKQAVNRRTFCCGELEKRGQGAEKGCFRSENIYFAGKREKGETRQNGHPGRLRYKWKGTKEDLGLLEKSGSAVGTFGKGKFIVLPSN